MAAVLKKPQFSHVPVEQLRRGRYQPRRDFDESGLAELAASIQSSGLIQPIVVRQCGAYYEIIAGERRWRAAQRAGLDSVPCLVNDYTDEQAAAVTLIENIQRRNLNPIEEAQSLQRLADDFHYSHEEIAAIVGKSRSQITNMLRLLRLDNQVQRWLIEGKLSEGHGKILAGYGPREQIALGERCIAQGWSVRQAEQQAKKLTEKPDAQESHRADITRLERIIGDQLGAKIKIETETGAKSGWLNIQFSDNDTLSGLLQKIGVKYDE